MRSLEDRIDWCRKELTAGGHHLVPIQKRIKIWTDGLCFDLRPAQIAERVKSAQESHVRQYGNTLPPLLIEAMTVLQLYVVTLGIPYELWSAELRLLASAPGLDQAEAQ